MRSFSRVAIVASALISVFVLHTRAQGPAKSFPYDHIHLQVDAAAGSAWYEKNFGGRRITEAANRIMYGSTRLMFLGGGRGQIKGSADSVINRIGFSVPDLDAKMRE